ncbi:hypothetical protein [Cellulomonas fimi]|uniref:hypothetical protein n=1 Tax=Cellulomonas fimi TaxID=1708 RepID=UPI000F83F54B|nr:hypothetical protein [Cellulomonas fimi]NNH07795.1 hypothetical protein [Cellulomonas fimi]
MMSTTSAPRSRTSQQWRARASLREGLTNFWQALLLGPLLVTLTTLVVAATLVTDAVTAARVVRAEQEYLGAGGDLLVAQRPNEVPIDVARCVALKRLAGVREAAAVSVRPSAARVVGRPESQQTLVLATAGALDLLNAPSVGAHEVLASQTIADRWQWAPGSHLQLAPLDDADLAVPPGVLTVTATADLALLSEGASTGLLLVRAPTGTADACFVRIEPQYREDLRASMPAALGARDGAGVTVSDRLPAGAAAADPAAAFDTRTTRWAPPFGGTAVGLLWLVVAWTRRGRAAMYASIGVPYSGGVLLRWTEGAAVAVLGCLWGAAWAVTASVCLLEVPAALAVSLSARGGASALCVALTMVLLVGLWRPPTLAALKDR